MIFTKPPERLIFGAILVAFMVYGLFLIYRTSFVVDGERYFCLADDQMISMRYARNLVQGHGLAWNEGGTKVEGYTNPLWVFYMAAFHLIPIARSKISLAIQLSGLIFLLLNLAVIRKIGRFISPKRRWVGLVAVCLTAFYFPLNYWSLHGFEAGILVLIINLSALLFMKTDNERFSILPYLVLGIGTLFRIDMAVPYLMFLIYDTARHRTKWFRYFASALMPLVFFVGCATVFRVLYYGLPLPNTYYLKLSGYPWFLRLSRGFLVILDFSWRSNWILLFAPFIILTARRFRHAGLFFLIILGQVLYSIYVGGDAWEWYGIVNRFIVIVMPLFFLLFSLAIFDIADFLQNVLPALRRRVYFALILVFSLFSFNTPGGVKDLPAWLLQKPPFEVVGQKGQVEISRYLETITKPEARIAVVWAGTIPYFVDRFYIDLLGRNDQRIAHLPMRTYEEAKELFLHNNITQSRFTFFYPGHLKWDYAYSLGELKPDLIVQLWGDFDEAYQYLHQEYVLLVYHGYQLIVLKDSPNIYWERIETD